MSQRKLRGVVSGLWHVPVLAVGGRSRWRQRVALRVDGRPVRVWLRSVPGIRVGDHVTAIGHSRNGVFRALAIRSNETQVIYVLPPWWGYAAGVLVMLGFGVPLMLAGSRARMAGLLVVLCGALIMRQAHRRARAVDILRYR